MINDYLALSVTDCKRLGYFKPHAKTSGTVNFTRGGSCIASIGFATDTTQTVPVALFSYTYNGTPVDYFLTLRFTPSHLNNGTGYYLFVCPVTGRSCRKLYLIGGRFVSRFALGKTLYESQTKSRREKTGGIFRQLADIAALENLETQPYRKPTYRGKLTRYGRKVAKLAARTEQPVTVYGGKLSRELFGVSTPEA